MNKYLLSAAGLTLFAAHPVLAEPFDQQAATPSVSGRAVATALSDIVVTANRSAQSIDKVPEAVTVLTRADLEKQQATALPDLIARTPSVSFTRNGGAGSVTTVNIRGAEGQHTLLLVDGVKMNDPSATQGGANFSNFFAGDIARIEVLRGAQSTLWGSQAIGGVINIVSAEPTEAFEASLAAEAGSYGTRYLRAAIGGVDDRLTWRLSANQYATDGFTAYATGTEKDGYQNNTLSGRLNYKLNDQASLDLRAGFFDGRNEYDAYNGDSREYGNTEEMLTYAGLNFDLLEGRLRNRIGYARTDSQRNMLNPDNQFEILTYESRGEASRLEYQGIFAFTGDMSGTFGIETESSKMRSRSLWDAPFDVSFDRSRTEQDSAYFQYQWTALPNLNLTAGIRYDDHAQYGDHTVGQLSAAWSLNDGDTILRANWGQGFRAPGLYELYSEYGNLEVQPERFDAWEVGIQQNLTDSATISVTYFNRQAENEIRYNSCYSDADPLCVINGLPRWGYYTNVQRTEAQGIEVVGKIELTPSLQLNANYTWTDAINASGFNNGKQLVRRPEHMANISADYAFSNGLNAGLAVRYSGTTFIDEANTGTLDSYTLVDLRASYPVNDTLEIYGRVENAFDEKYQTIPMYSTAGRAVFAGVRVKY